MDKVIYHAKQDPAYQSPFVDVDEVRTRTAPNGETLSYRYIHGGFEETNVKFSFCFPEKAAFQGRFFQYLSPFPGPDEELASLEKTGENDIVSFCLLHGAYYVETNMGSAAMFGSSGDNTIVYKSSAATAEFSRTKAVELYGCPRPYGYVFGGSGGGYKTMACIENTDAWDGAAPYVIGSPASLPNTITMHAQGQRALRRVFGRIVDALDAGGSTDPYAGLTPDEAAMLRELTTMGIPPLIWFQEASGQIDDGSLPVLLPGVKESDPGYFEDFWSVPGYLGADPNSSAAKDRLQFTGVVKSTHAPGAAEKRHEDRNGVDTAWKKMLADGAGAWIELEEVPRGKGLYLKGVNITVLSGRAAGKRLLLDNIVGNCLTIGQCFGMDDVAGVLSDIEPGDTVSLDNSDYIAVQSYYRHQVPGDLSFHAWDQFRDENGQPTLPQRQQMMGYHFTGTGTVQDGCIQGKVIVIQALMDESTCPWCGDWYRHKIIEAKGNEDDFRLYYMDRCMHGDEMCRENNMVTNYLGALRQALLDLSDWVERGFEPLPGTQYVYREGQIDVPKDAKDRRGLQPTVELLANGSACAKIKAGGTVHFTATAQVPAGAGTVTALDFGFEDNRQLPGSGDLDYPVRGTVEYLGAGGARAEASFTYDTPGTYFAAVRVKAQRQGDGADPFTQVKNIARARIIVE